MVDFAILAPVPILLLESGYTVAQERGYVSFGSQRWDLFREIEELRNEERVPVLIYPSYDENTSKWAYEVEWVGWYIGCVEDVDEKHQDEVEGHRPPPTAQHSQDNAYGWAVFWRVEDLQPLPSEEALAVSKLFSYKTGNRHKNAAPRGPELIVRPEWFDRAIERLTPLPATDIPEPPYRVKTTVNRIIRDTAKAQRLKRKHYFRCQICGIQLKVGEDEHYAEVHHIRPLGGEHNGTDDFGNMLVLCPNHHAQFDYGIPRFVSVNEVEIFGERYELALGHSLREENIIYHNQRVYFQTEGNN
jgi:hypothetical protein